MVDLNHQIPIKAPVGKVYEAIATSRGNSGWWTADSTVETRAGGEAVFGFEKRAVVFRMKINKLVPGEVLVMSCVNGPPEWEGTTLSWRVQNDGAQSILHFTHGGWRAMTDYCAGCNSMWGRLMYRLRDFVETGKADPVWSE